MNAQPTLWTRTICGQKLDLPGTKIPCLCKRPPGHEGPHLCGICSGSWLDPEDDEEAPS